MLRYIKIYNTGNIFGRNNHGIRNERLKFSKRSKFERDFLFNLGLHQTSSFVFDDTNLWIVYPSKLNHRWFDFIFKLLKIPVYLFKFNYMEKYVTVDVYRIKSVL